MPNLLMSAALSCLKISKAEEAKTHNSELEHAIKSINKAVEIGKPTQLFNLSETARHDRGKADTLIVLALLLYPQMLH